MVSETITEPVFRYIPDRDTIQRLLHRCSNMKDDLAEFELFEDKDEAQAAEDEAAAAANEEEEEDEWIKKWIVQNFVQKDLNYSKLITS